MTSTDKPAEPSSQRPLAVALGHATSDVKGIATLILTVATVPTAFVALRDAVHLPSPWPEIGCIVPIAIFVAFYFIPEWRTARDRKALEDFGVIGEPPPAGYFRLTPYGIDERAKFERPDGAEGQVLKWVQRSNETFLYLVGLSGVGKSSLLSAHVIPALKESGTVVIEARPYDDPIRAIRRALCKPGAIWKQPPADDVDVRNLIERAATAVARTEKRLLVVLDQFEEVLIVLGDEERQPFSEFLKGLKERPIESLTILLSLRLDYIGGLEALPIPPPTYGTNWFEIKRFTPPAARRFIEHSDLKPGPKLVEQILKEAAEIEDSLDQVRPVVVNMYGLVLASFKGRLPTDMVPGRLLSGYVRRTLDRVDLKEVSRAVIAPLVTDVGTKRARPLHEIAAKASITTARARGTLLRLAEDGLVRAVDKAGQHWEVSHDFVARLVLPLLESAHVTWWDRVRPWLAPGALGVWIIAVLTGAYFYPNWHDGRIRKELDIAGIVTAPSEKSGELAFQYNGQEIDEESLRKATRFLAEVSRPITKLDLRNASQLTSLKGVYLPQTLLSLTLGGGLKDLQDLAPLPNLKVLKISGPRLKSLTGMPVFPNLNELEVTGILGSLVSLPILPTLHSFSFSSYADEVTLVGMPILPSLENVKINYIQNLQSLKGLPALPAIQKLTLKSNGLRTLAGMPNLPTLTSLELDENSLTDLTGMPKLPALNRLILGPRFGVDFGSDRLTSLAGMPLLPALKNLEIRFAKIVDLIGVPPLPALKSLTLGDLSVLQSLTQLPVLPALERLELSSLPRLKSLKGMAIQPALKSLSIGAYFSGDSGVETLAGMPPLPALEELKLGSLPYLKNLDGIPTFPVLASLELNNTGLENLMSMPSLPSLTKLAIFNSRPEYLEKFLRRRQPSGIDTPKSVGIKSLADLPVLPNLREISLNDQLVETIPDRVRLEKVTLSEQVEYLFPLERFKATLRDLSIFSSKISDWNSIATLSNLERLEIGIDNFRSFNSVLLLKNLKSLEFSSPGELDLAPLTGSERELEIILNENNRRAIKLPAGGKYRITWTRRRDAPTSEDQD